MVPIVRIIFILILLPAHLDGLVPRTSSIFPATSGRLLHCILIWFRVQVPSIRLAELDFILIVIVFVTDSIL